MKKTIEISEELYKFLEQKAKFGETPEDAIKRLLSTAITPLATKQSNGLEKISLLVSKGVNFWEGMRLRAVYKGREYFAEIQNGKIVYDGRKFGSLSAGAVFICKGPVNGWNFWEYHDETSNKWKLVNILRN